MRCEVSTDSDFWKDADVIHVYTRAQAILDGFVIPTTDLVPDEPRFHFEAGWKVKVDVTPGLAAIVIPTEREADECHQDVKGRLWDVLIMARLFGSRAGGDREVRFPCIFWLIGRPEYGRKRQRQLTLKVRIGPGDDAEPVALIGLASDDLS